MLSVSILSSLLLISVAGIVILISYKVVRGCNDNAIGRKADNSCGIFSNGFKRKLMNSFECACKKGTHLVFLRVADVCHKAGKHVSGKYAVFADSMNGKGDTKQKGAPSFFLKSVSEHKKKMRGETE